MSDPDVLTRYEFSGGLYDTSLDPAIGRRRRDFRGFAQLKIRRAGGVTQREFYLDEGRKGRVRVERRLGNDLKMFASHTQNYSATETGRVYRTLLDSEEFVKAHQDKTDQQVVRRKLYSEYDSWGN